MYKGTQRGSQTATDCTLVHRTTEALVYVHGMTPSLPVSPLTDGALKLPLNQFEVLWRHLDGEEVEESSKLWLCDPTGVALSLHGGDGG